METLIVSNGRLRWRDESWPCAIGRSGVSDDRTEGDGTTPRGTFVVRAVYYRQDRVPELHTDLKALPLERDLGWCDDTDDPSYNQAVRLPHEGRAEALWREDNLYDIVGILGFNDDPVVPGTGSAIFLHVTGLDMPPTEGCIAVEMPVLVRILETCGPNLEVRID